MLCSTPRSHCGGTKESNGTFDHPIEGDSALPMGDDVTSQKDPLRWIFHRFRLRMRTQFHRMDIAQLSVSHVHIQRNPEGIT
jgi:hypothetical protein